MRCLSAFVAGLLVVSGCAGGPFRAGTSTRKLAVSAWLPTTWDYENSFRSLSENAGIIDQVSPVWYWAREDGSVIARLPQWKSGPHPGDCEADVRAVCMRTGVKLVPLISNSSPGKGFDADMIGRILNSDFLRTAHVRALTSLVTAHGYDGIEIDYEELHGSDRGRFSKFMSELADSLHEHGKLLAVAVHPKLREPGDDWGPSAQDYAAIGKVVDSFRIMTYDHHWASGPAGPLAPLPWFEQVLEFAAARVPANRIMMGLPTYGYDWTGSRTGKSADITPRRAPGLAREHGAEVVWDWESNSPHFSYAAGGGVHEVWYEDARCVDAKLKAVKKAGAAGVAVWRLGSEEPEFWGRIVANGVTKR